MDSGNVASKEDQRPALNSLDLLNQETKLTPHIKVQYLHILTKPALPR